MLFRSLLGTLFLLLPWLWLRLLLGLLGALFLLLPWLWLRLLLFRLALLFLLFVTLENNSGERNQGG